MGHLPLPRLTVSRMDAVTVEAPLSVAPSKRWQNSRRPQVSPRKGGGAVVDLDAAKRKVLAKPVMSIEETLAQRQGLRRLPRSSSSPLLLIGDHVGSGRAAPSTPSLPHRKSDAAQLPSTASPTPKC